MLKKKIAAALAAAMLVGAVMTTGAMAETVQFGFTFARVYVTSHVMKSGPVAANVSIESNN